MSNEIDLSTPTADEISGYWNPRKWGYDGFPRDRYGSNKKNMRTELREVMNLTPVIDSYQDSYQNFNRLYSIYPEQELSNLKTYVFMVRPSCNILTNGGSNSELVPANQTDPLLTYMSQDHKTVLRFLCDGLSADHKFIPFLVYRTESLQLADYTLKDSTVNQPYTNWQIPYGINANESITGGSFDITFREDNQLRVTKLFHAWTHYINGTMRGTLQPNKNLTTKQNKFDYMTTVYLITCAPDASTILYFSQYVGCFPTNVPHSNFSFNLRGDTDNKITIPFRYFKLNHFDPQTLHDFNKCSTPDKSSKYTEAKIYNEKDGVMGDAIVGAPYIVYERASYRLKWKTRKRV